MGKRAQAIWEDPDPSRASTYGRGLKEMQADNDGGNAAQENELYPGKPSTVIARYELT